MKHIAIVGNIGSGKSTLTRKLSERFGWNPVFESVDDNPYLEDFYADMPQWAFHLQIYFLNSRLRQVKHIQRAQHPVVQDRTIYEDAHIFARNLYLSGILNERDYANYHAIYRSMTEEVRPPDLLLYLKADLPKLQQQIALRGRGYEAEIPAAYLLSLNELYEEWIGSYAYGKVLVFDMNTLDFVNREADFQHIVDMVEQERQTLALR
jgi:deoxyadenosine/deoxycytidine kinase